MQILDQVFYLESNNILLIFFPPVLKFVRKMFSKIFFLLLVQLESLEWWKRVIVLSKR